MNEGEKNKTYSVEDIKVKKKNGPQIRLYPTNKAQISNSSVN